MFKKIYDIAHIVYVQPNSPADKILFVNDKILKINDKSIAALNAAQTLKLLDGPEGTVVKLELQRGSNIIVKELTKRETFISDYIKLDDKHYMNWKEIQTDNDRNIYTWVKFLNTNKNDSNLLYTKAFWGINCNSYYYTELEHIEYYKNGSYYQKPSITDKRLFKWSRIVPNSIGYAVAVYACSLGLTFPEIGQDPNYEGVTDISPPIEN